MILTGKEINANENNLFYKELILIFKEPGKSWADLAFSGYILKES